MNESDIKKYAVLMKELGLTGLTVTEGNKSVRLECNMMNSVTVPKLEPATESKEEQSEDYISIKSPIVGVFYLSATQDSKPFVSIGDKVEKGRVLCVIEAMKLMNEVTAEQGGEIIKICVADGQVVEYGTELFRIKR